jgi:hypothetical protein
MLNKILEEINEIPDLPDKYYDAIADIFDKYGSNNNSQLEPLSYTAAIKDIFSLIDENILVRNTADDGDIMKFMKQGIRITNTLANAKKLIDEAA